MATPGGRRPSDPPERAQKATAVSKYAAMKRQASRRGVSWTDVPAVELVECVSALVEDGAAVLLSRTSDGGALVLRVLDQQESTPWYATNAAEINEMLEILTEGARTG